MRNLMRYWWVAPLIVLAKVGWKIYGNAADARRRREEAELAQREADFASEGNPVVPAAT
jgi:hypothetical protein